MDQNRPSCTINANIIYFSFYYSLPSFWLNSIWCATTICWEKNFGVCEQFDTLMCVFYWQKLLIYKVSSSRDFRFFFFTLIATRRSWWWWWWRRVIVSHRKKDHLKFKSLSNAQEYVWQKSLLFQIKCACDHGQNYLHTTCQLIHICSRAMRLRTTQAEKKKHFIDLRTFTPCGYIMRDVRRTFQLPLPHSTTSSASSSRIFMVIDASDRFI